MEYLFTFQGGPRADEKKLLDVSTFPMNLPGGRYVWNGLSHATGMYDPNKMFPEPHHATAIWKPDDQSN
ncbi:hypothetical protein ACFY5D_03745 [Paeniglutamicibacter sp. NPDC012692]|uniref:hypothetical protein n=1 Tax=Paeniglutamicibacter sp. NPDC012692 TaxID=3364388 RepID=UPI0036A5A4E2